MNIGDIIERARLLAAILPMLGQFVGQAEQLFPNGGSGADKLRIVREWLEAAATSVGATTDSIASIWPMLSAAIATIVSALHLSGLFKKPVPPAQA